MNEAQTRFNKIDPKTVICYFGFFCHVLILDYFSLVGRSASASSKKHLTSAQKKKVLFLF